VAGGKRVVITRTGKPFAQLVPPPADRRAVRFCAMRGRIHLKPNWDVPVDIDNFLSDDF
jgi:antitoxin (DNA-binding transcriptional repressor) of toxin-antitoxin stability system